jgi:hypothetical protein
MANFDFTAALKRWPKASGNKPVDANVTAAAGMVKRPNTAKHMGLAMYLRPEGATQPEVITVTGDTQVNAFSAAWRGGMAVAVDAGTRNGHKVYKLALKASKPRKVSGGKGKGDATVTPPAGDTPPAE